MSKTRKKKPGSRRTGQKWVGLLLAGILTAMIFSAAGCDWLAGFNRLGMEQQEAQQQGVESDYPESDDSQPGVQQTQDPVEAPTGSAGSTQPEKIYTDGSKVVKSGTVDQPGAQIALTFDAGWLYENTEPLLNLLDEYNVKATFFARGGWVRAHPDLAKKIVNRGHDLENHSLTHGHMSAMTAAEIENEIRATSDLIRNTTGSQPHLFRPPYGEYNRKMLGILLEEGYPYTVMWTVDSHDWAEEINGVKVTKDYLVNRVLHGASDNGIILMHVGGYETVPALPEIISGLRAQGYELVKVKDMLQQV